MNNTYKFDLHDLHKYFYRQLAEMVGIAFSEAIYDTVIMIIDEFIEDCEVSCDE